MWAICDVIAIVKVIKSILKYLCDKVLSLQLINTVDVMKLQKGHKFVFRHYVKNVAF